jgi:hypothetical protein
MVTVHAETTRIGLAVTGIVDGSTAPFAVEVIIWRESLKHDQTKHRAMSQRWIGIVLILQGTPSVCER